VGEKRYYANVSDISEIPEPILQLCMADWFDKGDTVLTKDRIDGMWVRIKGEDKTVEARVKVLKGLTKVRHGGGVRIKQYRNRR